MRNRNFQIDQAVLALPEPILASVPINSTSYSTHNIQGEHMRASIPVWPVLGTSRPISWLSEVDAILFSVPVDVRGRLQIRYEYDKRIVLLCQRCVIVVITPG